MTFIPSPELTAQMKNALEASYQALMSYRYGNHAPALADEVGDAVLMTLANYEAEASAPGERRHLDAHTSRRAIRAYNGDEGA